MITIDLKNGRTILVANRAALPDQAVNFTPGYTWRLDLDIKFDGERPIDWPEWNIRMHIWAGNVRFTLTNGNGVTFESVTVDDTGNEFIIPIIRMSAEQTASLAPVNNINYVIDMRAPGGESEDYFAGIMDKSIGPPLEMLE